MSDSLYIIYILFYIYIKYGVYINPKLLIYLSLPLGSHEHALETSDALVKC